MENIFEYISKDNVSAARKMINKIFEKVETLSKYPERGRKVPEADRQEIRKIFEGEYRIIYRVEGKKVFILTIRNFKQTLPDKELNSLIYTKKVEEKELRKRVDYKETFHFEKHTSKCECLLF